jgi:hypothetical protein
MDKNKKDMKSATKTAVPSKQDDGKGIMIAPVVSDKKAGDKKYAAIKPDGKKHQQFI